MRQTMLTDQQASYLRDEKEGLAHIRLALADLDAPRDSLDTLQQAILQLDELFLVVIVGEFNAGKSALVNALLGEKVLREGATPTTSRVTLVKWGLQAAEQVVDESFAIYTHPLPLLKELNIVDTPGNQLRQRADRAHWNALALLERRNLQGCLRDHAWIIRDLWSQVGLM